MFVVLYFVAALATSPALATEPVAPVAAPVAAPAAPVAEAPVAPAEGAAPVAEAPVAEGAAPVAEAEKKEEVVVPATDAEAVATASEAMSAFAMGKYAFGA
jgi:hypothetical protein